MITCSECPRRAEWVVVVEGQEWIERFCSEHLYAPVGTARYYVYPYAA